MGYYDNNRTAGISELLGKTIVGIKGNESDDEMYIKTSDGKEYRFYHSQSCCENVRIEDVEGDLEDLLNSPLTQAEEVSNHSFEKEWEDSFIQQDNDYDWEKKSEKYGYYPESHTWTFYKFATIKGYVTIRWLGESNGYYGEGVDFEEVLLTKD